MKTRAWLHHLLSLAVLVTSSLSAFHSSEHLGLADKHEPTPSFSSLYADHSEDHDGHTHLSETTHYKSENYFGDAHHGVEQLCEECLFLSLLLAPSSNSTPHYLGLSKIVYTVSGLKLSTYTSSDTYHSRAPPRLNS